MSMSDRLKVALIRGMTPVVIRWYWRGAKATDLSVRDETMKVSGGAIGVRIYTPKGAGPFPVLHFFHGGGWVFGNLETHDALCRDLCVQGRRLVVAVDYRLAPENPFPIPVEDCLASLAWIKENAGRLGGDADSIVLCGDSSGGNLAAVAAQQARQLYPGMIKGQVLIYPVTEHCSHPRWDSYRARGNRQLKSMTELWELYLRNSPLWRAGMTTHELATPLRVPDLRGLAAHLGGDRRRRPSARRVSRVCKTAGGSGCSRSGATLRRTAARLRRPEAFGAIQTGHYRYCRMVEQAHRLTSSAVSRRAAT